MGVLLVYTLVLVIVLGAVIGGMLGFLSALCATVSEKDVDR